MSSYEKGGVPWDKIFDEAGRGRPEGTVVGKSGLDLTYEVSQTELVIKFSILDALNPQLYLRSHAYLPKKNFGLWLRTRGFQGDYNARHPDMHAREFVGEALEFFNMRYGLDPSHFAAMWINDRHYKDNYETFMKYYESGKDVVAAARQTWTARAVKDHNFTDIQEKDVVVDKKRGIVTANFWKRI